MIIQFDKYLFGTEGKTTETQFTNGDGFMTVLGRCTKNGFTWTANIGDCGMTIATDG